MENNLNQTTQTNLTGSVNNYQVPASVPDSPEDQEETYYDIKNFAKLFGYYKNQPELKKAIDSLAVWSTGLGFTTDFDTEVQLKSFDGWGNDSINDILFNLFVMKKVCGDSFAEIVRDTETSEIINLRPLNPQYVRTVVNRKGRVIRYEYRVPTKSGNSYQTFKPQEILHLCNDRVADEIHGVSVIDACIWVIEARQEAMNDWRRISHRNTIRVMFIDADDSTRLNQVKTEYATAIKNGELLIVPAKSGEAQFQDLQSVDIDNFLNWIQYLENFFYQAVGIPRVIATSENYTEAASKIGFLTFEPVYTHEQVLFEQDLLNQCSIKIKFNRPPSLSGMLQESEDKNTGQTNIQPNEVQASMVKNE